MAVVERYRSPDGLLELIVDVTDDDWSVGFDGFAWHTHGDMLTLDYGGTPASATAAFVDDVLNSRRQILVVWIDGKFDAVWVIDDPSDDVMKYATPEETIIRRLWNGDVVAPA